MIMMKSMKMPREDKQSSELQPIRGDYPYGLAISLDEKTIAKLGLSMPKVGDKFEIEAIATVTSTSENKNEDGKKHRSITLQITDMECEMCKSNKAEKLYK